MSNIFMGLNENLETIKSNLGNAKLIAVTKSVGIKEVLALKELGVEVFGENRPFECKEKIDQIKGEWHMIGHLQSNKVKLTVELFDMIQSVDSVGIANKINFECEKLDKIMPILIQVNISNEPQKYGFKENEIGEVLSELSEFKNIKIEGFMMMAPFVNPDETRQHFRNMKSLFDKYSERFELKWLSMGMSNDYIVAIEEGSNMVRVGSNLFS